MKMPNERLHEINNIEARIRVLKKELRSTWKGPMDAKQQELLKLKEEATIAYVIAAHVGNRPGKRHLRDAKLNNYYLDIYYHCPLREFNETMVIPDKVMANV